MMHAGVPYLTTTSYVVLSRRSLRIFLIIIGVLTSLFRYKHFSHPLK